MGEVLLWILYFFLGCFVIIVVGTFVGSGYLIIKDFIKKKYYSFKRNYRRSTLKSESKSSKRIKSKLSHTRKKRKPKSLKNIFPYGLNEKIENGKKVYSFFKEKDGSIKNCKIFKNGVLISEFDKGIIKGSSFLCNGRETQYDDNGKILSECTFVNGKREGFGVGYDLDGKINQLEYYKNDESIETNKTSKLILKEVKKYINKGVFVKPIVYLWKCKRLKIDVDEFLNDPNFKIS